MAGRADRTAEDTVEYRLFPEIPDGLGEKETQKFLEETLDSYLVHLSRFLVDYIWQCEPFHMAVVAGTSGGYRPGGGQDVGRTSGRLSPGLISIAARGRRTLCLDQGVGGGGVRDLVIDDISSLLWHLFCRLVMNRVSKSWCFIFRIESPGSRWSLSLTHCQAVSGSVKNQVWQSHSPHSLDHNNLISLWK